MHRVYSGAGLTHPPRLFSQETRNLRTNCPRLSTMMWTVDGCPCLTQSTARAPATAYMDTTLPHVIPAARKTHTPAGLCCPFPFLISDPHHLIRHFKCIGLSTFGVSTNQTINMYLEPNKCAVLSRD